MQQPEVRLVRAIARRLTAALELRSATRADEKIYFIIHGALRSSARLDAAFAAVQMLRDLDVVDEDEAAYLLDRMHSAWDWDNDRPPDAGIDQLMQESPEQDELLMAALEHQGMLVREEFFRSRGEPELADLIARNLDQFDSMVARGEESIFEHKRQAEALREEKRSTDSRLVMERVLALSSRETVKDWVRAWHPLVDSLREVTPATAVRAIREAHAIGAIDFAERLRLVDLALDGMVWDECEFDRQYNRLQEREEVLAGSLGVKYGTPDDQLPFEYRMAREETRRRIRGLTAVVLRRFGEHALANLLMNDPAEFERIRDEIGGV